MTPPKVRLPNLPFRPLVRKRVGETPLMRDYPKEDQSAMFHSARLTHSYGGIVTSVDLADMFGVTHHTIDRWFRNGVRWEVGEDLCDLMGLHPVDVWPDYYKLLSDAELEFEIERKIDDLVDEKIMEKIGGQ